MFMTCPRAAARSLLLGLALLACNDEPRVIASAPAEVDHSGMAASSAAQAPGGPALSNTLDVAQVSLTDAREFPGFATIASVGGRLLVSTFPSAEVNRFELGDDLLWREPQSLSFANYGTEDVGFSAQFFASERFAYLTYDVTRHVVWDPVELRVVAAKEGPALPQLGDAGMSLSAAYNRTFWIPKGNTVLKPFYYRDSDGFRYAPSTQIAVYDASSHEPTSIIDAPCQGLENATQDEAGNTYFSTWNVSPLLFLYGDAPAPCFRRVLPDKTLDEQWAPDVAAWTGGRPTGVMRYLADGKAISSVLHQEEIAISGQRARGCGQWQPLSPVAAGLRPADGARARWGDPDGHGIPRQEPGRQALCVHSVCRVHPDEDVRGRPVGLCHRAARCRWLALRLGARAVVPVSAAYAPEPPGLGGEPYRRW
jgi:hypothetical protein